MTSGDTLVVDPTVEHGRADAIATSGLTKHYGDTIGLDRLDLRIPSGAIFGYLGPNGAGKTTTIRLLMGLLRPTAGSATVLGRDVVADRTEIHRLVGYLPGDFVAYGDLTPRQYLEYLAALRGDVAGRTVASIAERLDLDMDRKIAALSHGNRQKVGLVQAFMHEPEVLVLDEPTSGLDPLVQREVLSMLAEFRAGGGTVFISSHVLAEVEAIADMVGILRKGRLVVVERVEALKNAAVHTMALTFRDEVPARVIEGIDGATLIDIHDHTAHLTIAGSAADLLAATAPFGIDKVISTDADLEDIFLDYYSNGADGVS